MRWFLQFDGRVTRKHGIARETPTGPKFRVEPLEPRLLLSGDPLDLLKDSLELQLAPEPVVAVQDHASSPAIDWGNTVIADHNGTDDGLPAEQSAAPLTTSEPPIPVEAAAVVKADAQTSTPTPASTTVVLDEDRQVAAS